MHELALCQALMSQVENLAREHRATRVVTITLGIGPLSGVEEQLLKNAFPVASAGTLADGAALIVSSTPVLVRCLACGKESETKPNRLVCGHCEDWHTELISGDELLLIRLEMEKSKMEKPKGESPKGESFKQAAAETMHKNDGITGKI